MDEKYLVMGIGSVGGVVASEMTRDGYRPDLVTNNPAITDAINDKGITFSTPDEEGVHIPAQAYTKLEDLPSDNRYDAILLIMKANNMLDAARATKPLLTDNGYFVSFQNGIVYDELAKIAGRSRILSAVVAFGSNMEAPAVYRRTTPVSRIYIGEMNGNITPRVQNMGKVLDHVVPTTISENIEGILWGKLLWNCAVSAICALAGGTWGEVGSDERGRMLFLNIYREAMDVADKQYIRLENVVDHNPRDYYLGMRSTDQQRTDKMALLDRLLEQYADVKPSTLQSLERGRETEIDYLNGYVVRKANEVGVRVPINTAIVRMINEIERGERKIDMANLDELIGIK
jgi:2-dehydropantoate 2-reductase